MREPEPLIIIDPTEFAALVAVLKAIAATTAYQHERLRPGGGQEWLNIISAACQEAVLRADIGAPVDAEPFRRKTMEHINRMLAGLSPGSETSKSDN